MGLATEDRDELAEASPSSLGIRLARSLVVLDLDPLAPRTPRLPHRRLGALTQLAASTALHMTLVVMAALIAATSAPGIDARRAERITDQQRPDVRHIVFLAPELPRMGSGGGGGGNQKSEPIRRAQGVGADTITLRVRKEPPPTAPLTTVAAPAVEDVPLLPSIVLDAKPLASGLFDQIGLPTGGVMSGTSTGPGSGGGVGSGSGTGIGSGRGPGFGPGSGGGTGGGVYRAGGAVSAPRLIKEVKPGYTSDALIRRIQGTVVLEVIVTADGCASHMHIVRSLDAGLDEEALAAVAQWRFEPGRLGAAPVDVLVRIELGFIIR
jgi:periplasmic protein TonB